jgi:signal transduction histidine kinase/PAS domain-containing protein
MATSLATIIAGLLVLAGWIYGIPFLKSLHPSYISMKANTALCFIFLGISALLLNIGSKSPSLKFVARLLAFIVILISLVSLLEYLFVWNSGIDEFLFTDDQSNCNTIFPGRLAFNTCVCFLLLASAIVFIDTKPKSLIYPAQIFPMITVILGMLPVLGYTYGADDLLTFAFLTNMALNTAIIIIILSFGVMCLRPSAGFLSILTVEGPGGYMARRLIPVTILIPLIFIWIRLLTRSVDSNNDSTDALILSLLYIVIFAFFTWKTARSVNSLDEQRILTQNELKQSTERFRSSLDNMMEGCQLIGFDWRYLYINAAAEKHNRRPAEELMGKIFMECWPGIEKTELYARMLDCMNNQIISKIEYEFVFQDGSSGWYDIRIQTVPEGIFILSADISDRVQSENYSLLSNEILVQLNRNTDSVPMIEEIIKSIKTRTGYEAVGIRVKDGDDYPYYKTLGFSEEFVEAERHLCSYDKNGNVIRNSEGNPLLECMCGNILTSRVDPTKSYFTSGGSFRSNNTTLLLASTTDEERLARTRNRCNSFGYESVALIPLRSGNEIIGLLQLNDHRKNLFNSEIISIFENLGSSIGIALMRNKAENGIIKLNEELENRVSVRTEQLMDSNKELESFAYSVSHDLRAPLRHVMGFSEKLDSELAGKNDPEITRLTGKIKGSASMMSLLIDELLNYSRLGRTSLRTATLSLNPIVDDIIKEAGDLTLNRNIEWKISKLPEVIADRTLIRLVLQNLINNAIKFTVKKENSVIEIGFFEKDTKETTFFVKDNGAGFNMDYASKLFGVFQRLHSTEEFEGTGIGLATVRRIIKSHEGTVWAEGGENIGATFFFTLPK